MTGMDRRLKPKAIVSTEAIGTVVVERKNRTIFEDGLEIGQAERFQGGDEALQFGSAGGSESCWPPQWGEETVGKAARVQDTYISRSLPLLPPGYCCSQKREREAF